MATDARLDFGVSHGGNERERERVRKGGRGKEEIEELFVNTIGRALTRTGNTEVWSPPGIFVRREATSG